MAKNSVTERIKITKTGKLMRRRMGLGHSRARKSGRVIRIKRSAKGVNRRDTKNIKKYLG